MPQCCDADATELEREGTHEIKGKRAWPGSVSHDKDLVETRVLRQGCWLVGDSGRNEGECRKRERLYSKK